jgi:hypothetical protein
MNNTNKKYDLKRYLPQTKSSPSYDERWCVKSWCKYKGLFYNRFTQKGVLKSIFAFSFIQAL